MKKIVLFLIFISNCFAADVKDVGEQKSSAEIKEQQVRPAETADEKNLVLLSTASEGLAEGNLETIEALLKKGTNPNIQDKLTGDTPLIRAARMGNLQIIELLKNNGADVRISDNDRVNPLIEGVISENPEIVKAILGFKGINEIINNKDISGFTALHHAVFHWNPKTAAIIVKLLLDSRVNPFIKNNDGKTALDLASEKKLRDVIILLHRYELKFNQNGEDLVMAAYEGDFLLVEAILRNRIVDVNYKTKHSDMPYWNATPLIAALHIIRVADMYNPGKIKEYLEIINMLLQAKVDTNIRDGRGLTALMWAASRDLPDIVKILIDNGANVNLKDNLGDTVLKWLANYKENKNILEIIKILLDAKANPNAQNSWGNTPLTNAIEQRFPEMVDLLIRHGADVNIRDIAGYTPLITTVGKLSLGHWKTYEEIVKLLVNAKADVNIQNKDGYSALMLAAEYGNENIVKMLLSAGANVNLQVNVNRQAVQGITALMFAAANGHRNIVELLINAGADINLKDYLGRTAKDYAKDKGYFVNLINKIEENQYLEQIMRSRESS